jgi:aminoglycoside/choline kinase family phosphotransferase
MTGLPIASEPAALEPAWLTSALRAGGALGDDVSVVEVEATPVGTGQMCDSLRLHLGYDRPTTAPASVIAKLPAADETSRRTAKSLGSYELEVRFYQQLAGSLPVRTPACHYADIDVEAADFVLLLEDLAPARPGDQMAGCSVDTAAVATGELVRLHAPRWGDATLHDLAWLHRDPEGSRAFLSALLPELHAGFRERYGERLSVDTEVACDALFGNLAGQLAPKPSPPTIVHGDYRLDNLLFGDRPGAVPVAVLDWQTVSIGSALSDVAYFLGAGLAPEHRRSAEEGLVREYHARLVAAGVDAYSWNRCWEDYRRGTWSGLVVAVAASMLVQRTDRGDEMFLTMANRHARHALDLDAAALLR